MGHPISPQKRNLLKFSIIATLVMFVLNKKKYVTPIVIFYEGASCKMLDGSQDLTVNADSVNFYTEGSIDNDGFGSGNQTAKRYSPWETNLGE